MCCSSPCPILLLALTSLLLALPDFALLSRFLSVSFDPDSRVSSSSLLPCFCCLCPILPYLILLLLPLILLILLSIYLVLSVLPNLGSGIFTYSYLPLSCCVIFRISVLLHLVSCVPYLTLSLSVLLNIYLFLSILPNLASCLHLFSPSSFCPLSFSSLSHPITAMNIPFFYI